MKKKSFLTTAKLIRVNIGLGDVDAIAIINIYFEMESVDYTIS
jgi:hypothetical protein